MTADISFCSSEEWADVHTLDWHDKESDERDRLRWVNFASIDVLRIQRARRILDNQNSSRIENGLGTLSVSWHMEGSLLKRERCFPSLANHSSVDLSRSLGKCHHYQYGS